jgi:cytochrome c
MKSILFLSALALWLPAGTAVAQDDEFYKTKNCIACHRVDRNSLGPSFNNVAAKYAGTPGADVMLAKKIREGGAGVWGPSPMPAQAQVSEDESLTLARWILQLK